MPHQSTAQVSSQAPAAQTQVRHALSPEVLRAADAETRSGSRRQLRKPRRAHLHRYERTRGGRLQQPPPTRSSADLVDGHRPNNTLGGIPTIAPDYSPAWDANLFEWTQDATNQGFRGQLREEFQVLTFVKDGLADRSWRPFRESPTLL